MKPQRAQCGIAATEENALNALKCLKCLKFIKKSLRNLKGLNINSTVRHSRAQRNHQLLAISLRYQHFFLTNIFRN